MNNVANTAQILDEIQLRIFDQQNDRTILKHLITTKQIPENIARQLIQEAKEELVMVPSLNFQIDISFKLFVLLKQAARQGNNAEKLMKSLILQHSTITNEQEILLIIEEVMAYNAAKDEVFILHEIKDELIAHVTAWHKNGETNDKIIEKIIQHYSFSKANATEFMAFFEEYRVKKEKGRKMNKNIGVLILVLGFIGLFIFIRSEVARSSGVVFALVAMAVFTGCLLVWSNTQKRKSKPTSVIA